MGSLVYRSAIALKDATRRPPAMAHKNNSMDGM
jgi:hypothetical protein